ncbi:NAD(P)-binding protein [Flagelloscypha sp. PMI_526]|nr:NAD(P)-binding protein [Flagelloscypha sp. PMI_526]
MNPEKLPHPSPPCAAAIAPDALILPARSHPEVEIYAVAARDISRANQYAKKHGVTKTFASYQELLDCAEIDVVYNPLPNALHYEWSMKALLAGKHLLLEKPSTDTAEETKAIFDFAEKKGLVVLEAFHNRFHPAFQRTKAILDSGELGEVKSISTHLGASGMLDQKKDIRFKYDLGGGALMDPGCYNISATLFFGGKLTSIDDATFIERDEKKIDVSTSASFTLEKGISATMECRLDGPKTLGFIPSADFTLRIECSKGYVVLKNFLLPHLFHSIIIQPSGKSSRTERAYTFEDGEKRGEYWWTTYRFQLEAFVDRVKGRTPRTWVEKEESIENMVWIEKVYEKVRNWFRPRHHFPCS